MALSNGEARLPKFSALGRIAGAQLCDNNTSAPITFFSESKAGKKGVADNSQLFPTELRGLAMGTSYNLARTAQLGAPVLVAWAVSEAGLAGGLGVPLLLALATASWVWVLPETRGITLPTLDELDPHD